MGTPVNLSASSSASSGPSASGGIGAGASFDIGGINFGYQPQTATASGSQTPPSNSGASGIGGAISSATSSLPALLIIGAVLAIAAYVVLKRK